MSRAAFFDVDDTLLALTSIFSFLRFDTLARGRPLRDYDAAMRELASVKAAGASREDANRFFYRQFSGRSEKELAGLGAEWYRAASRRGDLFKDRVLGALREHRAAGDVIVLVSGSFPPCLDPIGAHVGADVVICSRPEIRDGFYTGHTAAPMVGPRKAQAIRAEAASRDIRLEDCWGYGDHSSDLPMLRLVGRAVVVGDDPVMGEQARRHGWPVLP